MARKPRNTVPGDDDETKPIEDGGDDDRLIRVAKKRFKRCADWESTARQRFIDDVKFVNGDAYNMYQWPDNVKSARGWGTGSSDERPCLTINKVAQHCLQVVNDSRQNKTSIKVRPVGDEATYEAAQIYEGLFRHIEYRSNAQAAYTRANTNQVQGGIGYTRMNTDFVDNETFDQEILIQEVQDSLTVFMDPDYRQPDGSDMRFAFVFEDMPIDEFRTQYPDFEFPPPNALSSALGYDEGAWISRDHIRVAEYYFRQEKRDELIVLVDPVTEARTPIKRSSIEDFLSGQAKELREAFKAQADDPLTKRRPLIGQEVKWVKIAGDQIIDRKDWAGETVPIYFAIGTQTVIDGEMDRKGHVRALLDAQRMMNYNASGAIEYGALQGKTPWLAPSAAIEELDTYWGRENLDNLALLPYNHLDDSGNPIPPPQRIVPPQSAPVYQQGMENAANHMMLVSGQYQPMMGEPSNERSGKAIQARQRQGENSTYHFIDNLAMMIRRIGKDAIALFPKIYDTPRIIQIMGEGGTTTTIQLDPAAKAAYEKRKAETAEAAEQVIFNPCVGRYDVMSDVGPDYATRRQEAFNALSQIAAQNPELMSIIGDLVMLAADFPLADEAAERLRRMVPSQALGDGPNPQVVDLQQKLGAMQTLLGTLSEKLRDGQGKRDAEEQQKAVDIYNGITKRIECAHEIQHDPARGADAIPARSCRPGARHADDHGGQCEPVGASGGCAGTGGGVKFIEVYRIEFDELFQCPVRSILDLADDAG